MKRHFLAVKARIPIDIIGDYRFPSGRAWNSITGFASKCCCLRFDWPAFLRALGNRPDKSPAMRT